MDMDASGFGDLIQQAEQLAADIDGDGELPKVERNLRQIVDAGQQLWARTTQVVSRDTCDVKASILLGSRGFDLPQISQKLEGLNAAKTFEPIEPIRETDIQGFLKNEKENAMLAVAEECKKSTFDRADHIFWSTLENEWESEKQHILSALSGSPSDLSDVCIDPEPLLYDNVNMQTRSTMNHIEMAYSKEIFEYNEQILQGGIKGKLADRFISIFTSIDEKKVVDMWETVQEMTNVPLQSSENILSSRCSLLMRTALIQQARKYLEKKYFNFLQAVVFANLEHAGLGASPGSTSIVKSFLKIRFQMNTLENGRFEEFPVWAVIYFCLRCGNFDGAIEAAKQAGERLADFVPYLIEYKENEGRRLNATSEGQIRLRYRQGINTSRDAFKKIIFGILGGEMTDDKTDFLDKTDDYLWIKLCQLRPVEEDEIGLNSDRPTLLHLQSLLLLEYGESHFNAYQQPFLYFQVLFLTGQFEAAIEFLSRIEHLRCHAVHIAIVLYELNLLIVPSSHHAPLISEISPEKTPMRQLNFSRLIMNYTNKFEVTDPREALQYYFFLRELSGPNDTNLFMSCVSDLVLSTKEFEMLLGKIEDNGCRKPGVIDRFGHDTQAVIERVALDSEIKGQYEDAIKLYDLAKKHGKVLEILSKLLTAVLSAPNAKGSNRERLETLSISIAERYKEQGHTASNEIAGSFFLILDLMHFFNLAHNEQHVAALDDMKKLQLLPFEKSEVELRASTFSLYSEEVRRNFPDILLTTMNILYSEYKKTKQQSGILHEQKSEQISFNQDKYIEYLRGVANAIISFSGTIPYRMPGDTNARLVQLEVMMN